VPGALCCCNSLPIHRKVILKQHRNSVAAYKQSDVSQEWQLRAQYNLSLALLLHHHSSVAFCSGLPLPPYFWEIAPESLGLPEKKITWAWVHQNACA